MAAEIFAGTEAVGTTEHSLPGDAAFGVGTIQTTDVDLQLWLDLSDMIAGDDLQLRVYEKVQASDTQRVVYEARLQGPQSPINQVFPAVGAFSLLHGWDVTLDAIAGTVTVTWSGRNVGPALLRNVALSNLEFLMVDSTDHVTPKTGLTISGTRSIDGGAFGAVTGTFAEVANGIYQFDATAADMNGGIITFRFTGTAADDTFVTVKTG